MLDAIFRKEFPLSFLENVAQQSDSRFWQTKDAWCFEVDLPGVPKDGIEVSASGRHLRILGKRKRGCETYEYREQFILPEAIRTAEGITASSENGVLLVTVPKQASGNILQIPVN